MQDLLSRRASDVLRSRVGAFRAVAVEGPRQAGKTTLVRDLAFRDVEVISLDDAGHLALAKEDPTTVANLPPPVVIDEFQRGGTPLLLALKHRLDGDRSRGQVVLTGSTSALADGRLGDTLSGRTAFVRLLPLSMGEQLGVEETFLDALEAGPERLRGLVPGRSVTGDDLARGGFPEVVDDLPATARRTWFDAYVTTVVDQQATEERGLSNPADFRRLLRAVVATAGSHHVTSSLASELGMNRGTLDAYLAVMERVFLVHRLEAWAGGALASLTKAPKYHAVDSGLACALRGMDADRLEDPMDASVGGLWETFVVGEVAKQNTWRDVPARLCHVRDRGSRHEIDLVVEFADGRVAAVEVKRGRTVTGSSLDGLRWLRDRLGDRFVQGVLLSRSPDVRTLDDRLTAAPISALWGTPGG